MGFDRTSVHALAASAAHPAARRAARDACAAPSRARSATREPSPEKPLTEDEAYAAIVAGLPHLVVRVPGMRVTNGLNTREHWAARARRTKRERKTVGLYLLAAGRMRPTPPLTVRMVRVYPPRGKPQDGDGLHAAFKATRDAVAAWLGIDDAERFGVTWEVAQEPGPAWAVRIEFAPAGVPAAGAATREGGR